MQNFIVRFFVIAFTLLLLSSSAQDSFNRTSNVPQAVSLARQILCSQRQSWSVLNVIQISLKILKYGCWCGLHDYQGRTVDAIDRCCMIHDQCFIAAREVYYLPESQRLKDFFTGYRFRCANGQSTCLSETGFPREMCECDRVMGSCVAQNYHVWNVTRTQTSRDECAVTN